MWGFKESVGVTIKCCRTCDITREELTNIFDSRMYHIRSQEEHLERLAVLETLSGQEKIEFQRDTGIMSASPLAVDIPNSNINKSTVDVMHILLGNCEY